MQGDRDRVSWYSNLATSTHTRARESCAYRLENTLAKPKAAVARQRAGLLPAHT